MPEHAVLAAASVRAIADLVERDFANLQVPFLASLVRVPSDNPPGDCAAHAEHTAAALEALGFTVEQHPVPHERVQAAGMISVTNLVVRRQFGEGGPTVALNAHGDVVPPGSGWSTDPYGAEIRDGVMFGRGVAVSKSDIATYAFALRALEASGAPLRGAVELHVTYDEETGGLVGPGWLLEQGITRPDIAICAGFTYQVVTGHNGVLHLEIAIAGRSAHAAWPETGADALRSATRVMEALYRERETYSMEASPLPGAGHATLVVGTFEAGTGTNVVPDRARLTVDRRLLPGEDPEMVEARLRAIIEQAAEGMPGCTAAVRRILLARPLVPGEAQTPVVAALQRHGGRVLGEAVPTCSVALFTDARLYREAGCAAVLYGAGPRRVADANGHRADEQLVLSDLRAATEIVACALAELLAPGCEA